MIIWHNFYKQLHFITTLDFFIISKKTEDKGELATNLLKFSKGLQ